MTFRSTFGGAFAAVALGALAFLPAARAEEPLANINLPLEGWTVVAQAKGFFKAEYDKLGTQVSLVNPGTEQLVGAESAMLDRGGLAVAQRMVYPATVQRANGIDAVVVWLSQPSSPARTPILALKSSPVHTVSDLAGKDFGSSRIGCGWTSPTEILQKANLPLDTKDTQGKVRYTNISNPVAANTALLSGRIDATSTHVALADVAALVKTGEVKVVGTSPPDGVYVNAAGRVSYFAMRPFVEKYPSQIRAFLRVRARTVAWIAGHVDEAAAIIAKQTRVPFDIAKTGIVDPSEFLYMDGEPSADVAVEAIKQFQAWYIRHDDDILRSRHLSDPQIEAFVDRRFFRGGAYSIY